MFLIPRINTTEIAVILIAALLVSACGGGGGSSTAAPGPTPSPVAHAVTISWDANRETAVNSAGGGYTVAISGQSPINVAYVSGLATTPTTTTANLISGSYSVTVTAYSALMPPGGTTGSTSFPSAEYTFQVP